MSIYLGIASGLFFIRVLKSQDETAQTLDVIAFAVSLGLMLKTLGL